ncbi:MAG TPA: ATP-binding cassette domain-containing protein [Magnetospirillaceae bacterium]|jgi:peptide/nickel transport system ATP-binding protein
MAEPLVAGQSLRVAYRRQRGLFAPSAEPAPVLKGVDIVIDRGETVGIVGESGSGKSTLGRTLLGLVTPLSGVVRFDGHIVTGQSEIELRPLRRRMQMIFQDPMSSLNPRHTIGRILAGPALLHGMVANSGEASVLVADVMARVGLPKALMDRYPHELSGGQRQRVGIARAVILKPDFVVADEIVSGLDVSTQAQVLRLLQDLGREMGLALAFISHDLSVIRSICRRVYVMREGIVEEEGECSALFAAPKTAYTRALIDAIPLPVRDPNWLRRGGASEEVLA